MFVGYPRSGHSLIGSLLDAHPNMLVAHELSTLKYLLAGFKKKQIFYLLLDNSRAFTEAGRSWGGYSYKVPYQWQGRFRKLQILGDKKGLGSTLLLRLYPKLLQKLRNTINIRLRFLHVVRNPYDNISSISKGGNKSLIDSIELYFSLCETVADVRKKLKTEELFEIRHETFIDDPKNFLKNICSFLGTDAPEDYLNGCASIVFKSPRKTRYNAQWNNVLIDIVKERIAEVPFLEGYSYED